MLVAEKRRSERKRVEMRCWVALGPGPITGGFVSDISDKGAKLALQTDLQLPDKFDLYLTADGSVGRKCVVAWRKCEDVGVKFVGRAVPHRTSEIDQTPVVMVVE